MPPKGAEIVDGTGKFLIPGLWNNDLHGVSYDDAKSHLSELVAYGITTVRDMGASFGRHRTASRCYCVGSARWAAFCLLRVADGRPSSHTDAAHRRSVQREAAHDEVRSLKQHKVDYVEVDTSLSPELLRGDCRRGETPRPSSGWSHTGWGCDRGTTALMRRAAAHFIANSIFLSRQV